MVQIETVLGYGFHIPREQAKKVEDKINETYLYPMCHTCGQSPYFFGIELERINSRQAYIEFDLSTQRIEKINTDMTVFLNDFFEEAFGRKPPYPPKFMMFTDIR